MTNTVLIKRSSTANAVPTAGNLQPGELAINYNDGNLFYKNASNVVTVIASNQFVSVSGNITGNYIIGNGALLTGITINYSNANVAAYLPTYTGNLNPGNLTTSGLISAAGNVSASGIVVAGSGGDISGAVNITATGNISSGNILTIGLVSATGNVTGNYIIGNGAFLTGLPASYSNANVEAYLPTYTGNLNPGNILTTGFSSVTGNAIGGNFVTAGLVTATGNITGSHFIGNGATLTSITGANVTGTVANANNATYAGTVTANDQLNITSVGTLTSLNVTGNVSSAGNVTGNYILGNGYYLTGIPAGYSNSNVVAYGQSGWAGNIIPSGNGVYSLGNLTNPWKDLFVSGNTIYVGGAPLTLAAGNILQVSGQNVVYETSNSTISTTGNVDASNVATTGTVSATGNITTQGVVSATGNILTDGIVSAVGNITANYFFGNGAFLTGISGGGSGSTISVDDFTGNGVQTRFPLGVTPPSIDFTTVNYNGIIQLRTGYTIDGANVVFTTPPANGSSIEVTTISSANIVTFGPAGTNTQVQFNNANTLGASSAFTFNTANNTVSTGNVEVTGNVTAAFFVGNGSQLTGIATSSYSNSNAAAYGEAGWAGNIVPSANLTYSLGNSTRWWSNAWFSSNTIYIGGVSVGVTGDTLTVAGNSVVTANATGTSTTAGNVSITGDVTGGNVLTAGVVSSTGNVTGGNVIATTGLTVGTFSLSGNSISSSNNTITIDPATEGSGGHVIIQGNLSVTGNVTYINSNNVTTNDLTINLANNAATPAAANGGGVEVGPAGSPYATITYSSTANIWVISNGASVSGNVTGGNVLTSGLVSAAGNVTAGAFVGNGATLTSVTGANVTGTVANATYATSAGTAGTVTTNAQPNITSVGTLTSVTVTANITGGNLLTAGLISATSTITSAANITGGNILASGLVSATGNITAGNILGGANVNATTHTGTTVSVTANVTGGNIVTAGLITATGNISSAGNVSGTYFIGNGSQLTGITASATASGANTQIQFNDAGSLGASANLTFDKSTNTLNATTVTANGVPLATTGKAIAMAIVFGF